jgi:hypothetical protein
MSTLVRAIGGTLEVTDPLVPVDNLRAANELPINAAEACRCS